MHPQAHWLGRVDEVYDNVQIQFADGIALTLTLTLTLTLSLTLTLPLTLTLTLTLTLQIAVTRPGEEEHSLMSQGI